MRYRKVDPRIWTDESFTGMSATCKLVALYVLTSSQMNRIGLFSFSIGKAIEDTGIEDFDTVLDTVCDTLSWERDRVSRVLFLPRWWKYNRPDNKKHLKGVVSDVHEVPHTPLIDKWANNLEYLDTLASTFCEYCMAYGIRYPMGYPMPYQEQEQEQEQKQEIGSIGGSRNGSKKMGTRISDMLDESILTSHSRLLAYHALHASRVDSPDLFEDTDESRIQIFAHALNAVTKGKNPPALFAKCVTDNQEWEQDSVFYRKAARWLETGEYPR